jgi:hypothetical protein
MPLLGRDRRRSIAIERRDDAVLGRSGASIIEPLPLVSVGPFHEACGAAISQGNVHSANLSESHT